MWPPLPSFLPFASPRPRPRPLSYTHPHATLAYVPVMRAPILRLPPSRTSTLPSLRRSLTTLESAPEPTGSAKMASQAEHRRAQRAALREAQNSTQGSGLASDAPLAAGAGEKALPLFKYCGNWGVPKCNVSPTFALPCLALPACLPACLPFCLVFCYFPKLSVMRPLAAIPGHVICSVSPPSPQKKNNWCRQSLCPTCQ